MPNLSIDAINQVLKKIQAPGGDANMMRDFLPNVEQSARSEIVGGDQVVPQMKEKYMAQLAQIAAMDQKLAGVYGDPNSPLYIERASTRQNLKSKASDTGYKETGRIAKGIQTQRSNLEKDVNEVVSSYKQLIAVEAREEAIAKRATAQEKKQATANIKAIKEEKEKIAQSKGLTVKEMDELIDLDILDTETQEAYLQTPSAARAYIKRSLKQSPRAYGAGLRLGDLNQLVAEYEKKFKKKSVDLYEDVNSPSSTPPTANTKNIDLY